MLDFGDRTRTGISILTTVTDNFLTFFGTFFLFFSRNDLPEDQIDDPSKNEKNGCRKCGEMGKKECPKDYEAPVVEPIPRMDGSLQKKNDNSDPSFSKDNYEKQVLSQEIGNGNTLPSYGGSQGDTDEVELSQVNDCFMDKDFCHDFFSEFVAQPEPFSCVEEGLEHSSMNSSLQSMDSANIDREGLMDDNYHEGNDLGPQSGDIDIDANTLISQSPEKCNIESKFEVSKTFDNFVTFKDQFDHYCKQTYALVCVRSSHKAKAKDYDEELFPKSRITFQCKFFPDPRKIKSRGKNIRPNQSYCASNCQFLLSLSLKNKQYVVTESYLKHNGHPLGETFFKASVQERSLNENEISFVREQLVNLGNSVNNVKDALKEKFGKELTNKDLLNLRLRMQVPEVSSNDLEATIKKLRQKSEDDQGASLVIESEIKSRSAKGGTESTVKVIYFQDSEMKDLYIKFGESLFMDGTYSLTNKEYILIPLLVVDNHNYHQLVAWAFVSNEKKEQLKSVLTIFKEHNPVSETKLQYVIIDKDYSEINSICSVFKNATYIICRWHALKAVERYVRKIHLSGHEQHFKKTLIRLFRKMVFEPTIEGYMSSWNEICLLKSSNPAIEKAKSYFLDNWHMYREHFAYHVLKAKALQKNFTNNRSENFNKQLKDIITVKGSIAKAVEGLLFYAKEQKKRSLFRFTDQTSKFFRPTTIEDSYEAQILELTKQFLTKEMQKRVMEQYQKSLEFDRDEKFICLLYDTNKNQVKCPKKSGECSFFLNWGLPCSHLLFVRKINNELLIEKAMIRERWLVEKCDEDFQSDPDNNLSPINYSKGKKRKSKKETLIENKKRCTDFTYVDENLNVVDPSIGQKLVLSPKKGNTSQERKKQQEKYYKAFSCPSSQDIFNDWYKSRGAKTGFNNSDFEGFNNPSSWLNDLQIMYGIILLREKFGTKYQGLFDTTLYHDKGFEAINPLQDFIQPIHTGSSHWSVITNIGVPEIERQQTVIYYDSLVKLKEGSKTRVEIPPAVTWQICQLMKKSEESNLIVKIRKCSQQQNYSDCGFYTIANCVSLCFGIDIEELVYTGNLRSQYLDMLLSKKIEIFTHENENPSNQFNFTIQVTGKKAEDRIYFPQFFAEMITPICHCKITESFGDIVLCDECNSKYHLKCYLMAGEVGKIRPAQFLCYTCRPNN